MDEELDPGPSQNKRGHSRGRGGGRGRGARGGFSGQRSNSAHYNRDNNGPGSSRNHRNSSSEPSGPGVRANLMSERNSSSQRGRPDSNDLQARLMQNPRSNSRHDNNSRSNDLRGKLMQNQRSNSRHDNNSRSNDLRGRLMQKPRSSSSHDNNSRYNDNFQNNDPYCHNHGSESRNRGHGRKKFIGFKRLEEISQSESQDVLAKITESKDAFIEIIQSPIEKYDVFVLVIKCLEKVCRSSFDELKLKLLMDTCNSRFIDSLRSYLADLPYVQSKAANNMYWKDPDTFWTNLIFFFEILVNTSPTLAMNKCRSLIEATSSACLELLKERHDYNLPSECLTKLQETKEKMASYEKIQQQRPSSSGRHHFVGSDGAPPENFRELSIMPTKEDLLEMRPFLRPNIVDGAYKDVEHYLDVQFRLLREDCFGPLRQGLNQYLQDNKRRKFDHIRVFHNVKFVRPYVSQTKIGSLVQIDLKINKGFKRINWNTSKRFIYGGLVLFTKDNCRNFLVGTILDHIPKYLMEGLIPVSLMGTYNEGLYNDVDSYTMIESEVYFEPYLHVLKALQDPTFPEHLAMQQYIVEVNPEPRHPSYLAPNTVYKVGDIKVIGDVDEPGEVEHDERNMIYFRALEDETWPGKDSLHFNESQLEAYKLALTHELAVIQGPPGTGKTYLGIKVAETLLRNLKDTIQGCILLIICYTNHALDQFLEALLKCTRSIVRIGGQSRNEAMDNINLNKLRNYISTHCEANRVFRDAKNELKSLISDFQHENVIYDVLTNGVLNINMDMFEDMPEMKYLADFYNASGGDFIVRWLFDNTSDYYNDDEALYQDNETYNAYEELEKETRKRVGVVLDEEDKNETELKEFRHKIAGFSMVENDAEMQRLLSEYKKTSDSSVKANIRHHINILNARKDLFNDMSKFRDRRINLRVTKATDFNSISRIDRWTLYFTWIRIRTRDKLAEISVLQDRLNAASTAYEEARMLLDMQVLRTKRVVGMTTSGAARLRKLLQTVAPPIVIVEEAAEVLEQHIITSLTKSCQHLILIGDHQQLRPSAAHMKLARDYQLEVSLFERMICNNMHSRRLGVQHRMRPDIAALVCPHIYPTLDNHPTVYDFPDVKGITTNLFFLTHQYREQEVIDNMSRTNHEEGDLVLALANYLMQQGYGAEDVTVLAAYKGQMFYMRKESEKYTHLKGVKITVVDNYQGEESKIILLSLVRNNTDNKIGFLGTANRICVALSRAREGFYIFGNIDNLKANSELWRNIATTLENGNSLGTSITLKCQNHPNSLTPVSSVEDFKEAPEGGCKLPCGYILARCGHECLLVCHGYDRLHTTPWTRCPKKCERIPIGCELNHVCPKKCAEECGPCKRKLRKKLPCGHEADVYCHLEPDDPVVKCFTMVDVTLPDCGHKTQAQCHQNIKEIKCKVKCEYRVENCGHSCLRTCHVNDDPDHDKYLCHKACARAKKGCRAELLGDRGDHQCNKKCYETCDECNVRVIRPRSTCTHMVQAPCKANVEENPCTAKCNRKLPCNHFCKRKCSEVCGDCNEMVVKVIPDCKHKIKIQCKETPTKELCTNKCQRKMTCGHKCKGICGEECNPALCTEPSGRKVGSPCGHQVILPCNIAALPADRIDDETLLSVCNAPCGAELACGHLCAGSCGSCHCGRMHAPCTQPCRRPNICTHECEEPCNQVCPPCKKPCEVRCQHARCSRLCGAPCTLCKEECGRRCVHRGKCSRRCGEQCARPPCDAPCAALLACGHKCRGLCAEPCPPVCKLCDPDNFPRDFLGDEFDDDARFVLLQDCGHVMEVENMDNMMMSDTETVEIRRCPFCRKPIINTGRYKDLVNKTFREEINPIKERVYGNKEEIEFKKIELAEKISEFTRKYENILTGGSANADIKTAYIKFKSVAKPTKKVSKLQLDMVSTGLTILDMIAECYKAYLATQLSHFKKELEKQIQLLLSAFTFKLKAGVMLKISEQQQKDLNLEIKRMHAIVQLAKLFGHGSYVIVKEKVSKEYKAASAAVFCVTVFDAKKAMEALETLQKTIKVSGLVTKQERDLVVKAIGLKAGRWYKCPNGHFYCIGECGGAMQESKCIECGAGIGGTNHALRRGNAHAPEMDGSRFAAWSEEYNNMANFRLD